MKKAAVTPMEKIDAAASLREIVCTAGCFVGTTLSAEATSVQSRAVSKVARNFIVNLVYVVRIYEACGSSSSLQSS